MGLIWPPPLPSSSTWSFPPLGGLPVPQKGQLLVLVLALVLMLYPSLAMHLLWLWRPLLPSSSSHLGLLLSSLLSQSGSFHPFSSSLAFLHLPSSLPLLLAFFSLQPTHSLRCCRHPRPHRQHPNHHHRPIHHRWCLLPLFSFSFLEMQVLVRHYYHPNHQHRRRHPTHHHCHL